MALLQRTLASNSIWIGTGQSHSNWGGYATGNYPFAIYDAGNPLLYFQTSSGYNTLYFDTKSNQRSKIYSSGFFGEGFEITAAPSPIVGDTRSRWSAAFDQLWVRGSLNVWQFVINQIRATNGALWVSDAAKADSVSIVNANTVSITFNTGSMLPFVNGDIIRSKRWLTSGSTISGDYDVILTLANVDYANGNASASIVAGTFFTNSSLTWAGFSQTASAMGSQWVRVGSATDLSRQGSIYLTSNDLGGPFLDVYDSMSSVALAYGGSSQGVSESKVRLRLGKLSGISDTDFGGQLLGYGLYADNAYLKGKIWANQGGQLAGWTITNSALYNGVFTISSAVPYIGLNANTFSAANGIYIGKTGSTWGLSLVSGSNHLKWDGTKLQIQSPKFTISANGDVTVNATITASAGQIGGWTISADKLSSGIVTISSATNDKYIGIGKSTYAGAGIYLGSSSTTGQALSLSGSTSYLNWSNSILTIKGTNFQLDSSGNMSASNATFSGIVTAAAGNIGGWTISSDRLSSGLVTLSAASTNKYLGIGASAYDAANGIYIGSASTGGNRFSIKGAGTTGLYWDGANLGITSSNFTLSQGNITAKGGSIAGWEFDAEKFSKSATNTSVAIRVSKSAVWDAVSRSGYTFNKQSNELVTVKDILCDSTTQQFNLSQGAYYNTKTDGNHIIQFTSSYATSTQVFAQGVREITAEPNQTVFLGVEQISITPSFLSSPYFDSLGLHIITGSNVVAETILFTTNYDAIRQNIFLSYTNPNAYAQTLSINLTVKSSRTALSPAVYAFTTSYISYAKSRGYTQLNPHGLLVYAGPTNFIKLTTENDTNYGVISVDELYVGGQSIKGGASGSSGGGGIDGGGTAGYIPLWSDANTIENSPLSYDSTKVSSSAPLWSDTTIYNNASATVAAVGRLPQGVTFTNMPVTQVLNNILYYETPTLTAPLFTNFDVGTKSGNTLYIRLGQTLTVFTASTTPGNFGSFNSQLGLLTGSGTTPTDILKLAEQPSSNTAQPISVSAFNKTYAANQNMYFRVTASSTLDTTIASSTQLIRWRQPVYSGYYDGDISSLADIVGISQAINTATTPSCASTNAINSTTNAYYYVVFAGTSATMLTGKDQNNGDILWAQSGGGSAVAPCPESFGITCSNGFQTNTYKVYRTYNKLSGLYTLTVT